MNTNTVNRVAKGECPLCYTENPYTVSICAECYLPLPWARADVAEREPSGQCLRCQTDNPYTCLNCSNCGGRLPWANAVSAATYELAVRASSNAMAMPAAYGMASNQPYQPGVPPMQMAMPAPTMQGRVREIEDEPNQAVNVMSFLAPVVGLFAYVSLQSQSPRAAMSAGRSALCGLALWVPILLWFTLGHGGASRTPARTPAKPAVAVRAPAAQDAASAGVVAHGSTAGSTLPDYSGSD